MSYRCGFCDEVVPKNTPMKKHVVTRTVSNVVTGGKRQEVAKETPWCEACEVKHTAKQDHKKEKMKVLAVQYGKPVAEQPREPLCDVCGQPATGGQVTAESTLCVKHLRRGLMRRPR